jgi:hypothetical protein
VKSTLVAVAQTPVPPTYSFSEKRGKSPSFYIASAVIARPNFANIADIKATPKTPNVNTTEKSSADSFLFIRLSTQINSLILLFIKEKGAKVPPFRI